MTDDDPAFSARVRTTASAPTGLIFIETVGKAIDVVNDLSDSTRETPHWQRARGLLYKAYDAPSDAAKTKAAEAAFREALEKERWLN